MGTIAQVELTGDQLAIAVPVDKGISPLVEFNYVREGDPGDVGDAYCYIAIERSIELVKAWHLGKCDLEDTCRFFLRVRGANSDSRFQISMDGFEVYEYEIELALFDRTSYGRVVNVADPWRLAAVFGDPDFRQIETTYVERFNGTVGQWCKGMTHKTYAFSENWGMLEAALALDFASHHSCRVHETRRQTPAVAAGLTDHP